MRAIIALRVALLVVLSGCTSHASDPPGSPAKNAAASPRPSMGGAEAKSSPPPVLAASYEVRIASAQADRVQALEGCDSKPKAERAACNRAADSAYDAARTEAEKFRDSAQ